MKLRAEQPEAPLGLAVSPQGFRLVTPSGLTVSPIALASGRRRICEARAERFIWYNRQGVSLSVDTAGTQQMYTAGVNRRMDTADRMRLLDDVKQGLKDQNIQLLERFKHDVKDWKTYVRSGPPEAAALSRQSINQSLLAVRQAVTDAGCLSLITIEPPAGRGQYYSGIDPFDYIFDAPYRFDVTDLLCDRIDQAIGVIRNQSTGPKNAESQQTIELYVAKERLAELRTVQSPQFNLSRLIRLCEEINACYANDCLMATAMLVRAILDHVPPIFALSTFEEVCNNYRGTKSFKQSMEHLQNSARVIADSHLHVRIRERESLPTRMQVDFKADLDVLLAETVRLLK